MNKEIEDKMITKKEVAEWAGMSVSWLDNSCSSKAVKLRKLGVRYGKAQSSPVRYLRSKVIAVCKQDEGL